MTDYSYYEDFEAGVGTPAPRGAPISSASSAIEGVDRQLNHENPDIVYSRLGGIPPGWNAATAWPVDYNGSAFGSIELPFAGDLGAVTTFGVNFWFFWYGGLDQNAVTMDFFEGVFGTPGTARASASNTQIRVGVRNGQGYVSAGGSEFLCNLSHGYTYNVDLSWDGSSFSAQITTINDNNVILSENATLSFPGSFAYGSWNLAYDASLGGGGTGLRVWVDNLSVSFTETYATKIAPGNLNTRQHFFEGRD